MTWNRFSWLMIWMGFLVGDGVAGTCLAADEPAWVGTGSCAATACHGGRREPLDLKGSEYAFWGAYDPHNKAFSVLYDDRSKLIEKNYRRLVDVETARPFEDELCLKCHVHQDFDIKAARIRGLDLEVADGVGCEGCHGPAKDYLTRHVQAGWQGLTEERKAKEFGMRPTKDLLARGKICAECHVGLPSAEVNHDLIASGHPRLNFEYGSQLAKVPKHWRTRDDQARHPDYEAKVWVLGQLLAAKASIDLLESRASRSISVDSTTPWPEFSESSCFSCHHELVVADWRQTTAWPGLKPGSLPWSTWYLPMMDTLTLGRTDESLRQLREVMAQPSPDPSTVARLAKLASDDLERRADRRNRELIPPSDVKGLLCKALDSEASGQPLDWDRAAQQYLAIVALDKAMADSDPRYANPSIRLKLDQLRGNLDLPLRVERRGGLFDSPYHYDPAKVIGDLRAVRSVQPNP